MSSPQVKSILDAAWRRKWLLVLPPLLGLTVGWAVVERLPKLYTASTTIVVEGQRVSEDLAESIVTAGLSEILANIRPTIFRPENLDPVAEKLGMVPEEATSHQKEAARTELKRMISISENARMANFTITAEDTNPKRAAKAANLVADLYLKQYQENRTELAGSALNMFQDEKDLAAKELRDAEAAIVDFQRNHYDDLPERVKGYQDRITLLQQRSQQYSDSILAKEGQITQLQSQDRTDVTLSAIAGTLPPGVDGIQRKLDQARAELAGLLVRYSEQHPDVRAKRNEIAGLEQQYAAALGGAEPAGDDPGQTPRNTVAAQTGLLQREVIDLKAKKAQAETEIENLYARMRNAPFVARQLGELETVRNEKRAAYNEFVQKAREARAGMRIEEAGQGARLRQISKAYRPIDPSSPNVPNYLFGGAAVGLLLGLGIAFLLEQLDPSLRTEEAFRHAFPDLPLLAAIPSLVDPDAKTGGRGPKKKRFGRKGPLKKTAAMLAVLAAWAASAADTIIGGLPW